MGIINQGGKASPEYRARLVTKEIRQDTRDELLAAIDESERAGIKRIGVSQPKEDIEARMLLERLRLKRKRRWGDKRRGLAV